MNATGPTRPIPLFLVALVAFFSALVALAVSNGHGAMAHGAGSAHAAPAHAAVLTREEATLRAEMRRLWEDHITWTRLAVISLTTDAPDTAATVARLLRNQDDIGDAVVPFYGAAAGAELARLLREHILVAAEVIAAARAGDIDGLTDASARWDGNAEAIAGVLHAVNPRHWPLARMRAELRTHLRLTTDEVVARLESRWEADVVAYDRIHRHALHFADLLSDGLVAQFPTRFR